MGMRDLNQDSKILPFRQIVPVISSFSIRYQLSNKIYRDRSLIFSQSEISFDV